MGSAYDKGFTHPRTMRTRQPTNLVEVSGSFEVQVQTIASAHPAGAINKFPSYSTGNQRFLHVYLDSTGTAGAVNVTVYGANRSFGKWGPLYDVRGTQVKITANNTIKMQIFEIAGVDRVYFLADTFDEDDELYAGTSTF